VPTRQYIDILLRLFYLEVMSYIGAKCPQFGGIKIKAHQLYMVSALGLGDVE
jgi:hypothetical protein